MKQEHRKNAATKIIGRKDMVTAVIVLVEELAFPLFNVIALEAPAIFSGTVR